MALTPKQEKFAQCVADGMSQADAYRAAFDVGEDTKPESIYPEASKLMANHNIATRVQELKDKLVELSLWKRLDSVQTLADIANSGHEATKDRIAAVKELNAMHGWNAPQKVANTDSQGNDIPAIPMRIALVAPDMGQDEDSEA